ncbi:MAG: hemolysin secretion protein D [Coxiella sp. DG_40]|nr:MAG: hemolysin secretion protein D [Coxiella sp. DG_40]
MKDESEYFKLSGRFAHIILWGSVIFLAIMFCWAYFAILDEVTTAQGKVISSKKTQLVQNLEGGIVKQILVHEGEVVDEGQILMRLDDIRFSSNYKEGRLKKLAMEIKIARLKAELNDEPFVVSEEYTKEFPELVNSEKELYASKKRELDSLLHKRSLLAQEIDMTKPLLEEGAVSKVELLRLEQQLYEVNGTIDRFRSSSLQELNAARAETSRLQENNVSLKDQLVRTELRSPVKGIVKQIYVAAVGEVVKSGMPLIEVVPLDDTLLVEARVLPRDIGFLHPGQEAIVKISAYDFSIYGGLQGKVEHISADTTVDQRGNSYYEVWVRTGQNYLEKNDKKLRIIPGMQATVDVLTGHKSVLDYLLKPILKTKQEALRER